MKAMIFAAGMGSRLGEVTKAIPKSLVTVNGKPLIEYVIERLKSAGVTEILINLHYLGDQIEKFLASRSNFGLRIEFSHEEKLLGTGGGLKKAADFFRNEKNFIVHNSDVFSDVDLAAMRSEHERSGALATLGVMSRDTSRYLLFDSQSNLCGWMSSEGEKLVGSLKERPAGSEKRGFSGIQIISPNFFKYLISEKEDFSIITGYLNAAASGERITAYSIDQFYWLDVGKPETLEELRQRLARK